MLIDDPHGVDRFAERNAQEAETEAVGRVGLDDSEPL
jgi:hypothetical protein